MLRKSLLLVIVLCASAFAQTNAELKAKTQSAIEDIWQLSALYHKQCDAAPQTDTDKSEFDKCIAQFMADHGAVLDDANALRNALLVRLNREVSADKLFKQFANVKIPTSQLSNLAKQLPDHP